MEHGSGIEIPVRTHRQWTPLARALTAVGDHWTLLIVLALSRDKLRLSVLRDRLPGISSGVLDHHLGQMVALGLISRERFREMPPRVEVALTESGAELLPIAAALARWGMRHEWPMPESQAHVRADAILRQLPALLEEATDLPAGVVEMAVRDGNSDAGAGTSDADAQSNGASKPAKHRFEIADGRIRACVRSEAEAAARIEGDEAAWIAAFGPRADSSGLHFSGKRSIAKRLLDSLPRDNRL